MSKAWFAYTGPAGGELNTFNYTLTNVTPTCLDGTRFICAIYSLYEPEVYGAHPSPLSANIRAYIPAAKATSIAQPIGISNKKYIYTYPQ